MFLDRKVVTGCGQRSRRSRFPRCAAQSVWLLLLWVGVLSPQAHAYTDPGSGALLMQALVAGAFGLLFYARKFWYHLLSRRNDQDVPTDPREDE